MNTVLRKLKELGEYILFTSPFLILDVYSSIKLYNTQPDMVIKMHVIAIIIILLLGFFIKFSIEKMFVDIKADVKKMYQKKNLN